MNTQGSAVRSRDILTRLFCLLTAYLLCGVAPAASAVDLGAGLGTSSVAGLPSLVTGEVWASEGLGPVLRPHLGLVLVPVAEAGPTFDALNLRTSPLLSYAVDALADVTGGTGWGLSLGTGLGGSSALVAKDASLLQGLTPWLAWSALADLSFRLEPLVVSVGCGAVVASWGRSGALTWGQAGFAGSVTLRVGWTVP